MKKIKKDQGRKQDINIETYLKKIRIKKENKEKTDIIMSEEKKQKLKEYQKKISRGKKVSL